MKIRTDLVSNSSSSSFVIERRYLSQDQVDKISNHSALGEAMGLEYANQAWDVLVTEYNVFGDTFMDNFDMGEFLEKIGVPEHVIRWGHP